MVPSKPQLRDVGRSLEKNEGKKGCSKILRFIEAICDNPSITYALDWPKFKNVEKFHGAPSRIVPLDEKNNL